MEWVTKLYIGGKPTDLLHPFEEELVWLVSTNYRLVMENIDRKEEKETTTGDYGNLQEAHSFSVELRRAATNLALVGLVTRLHHWLSILVEELTRQPARHNSLVKNLIALEKQTGKGPVPISFFSRPF